MCVVCTDWVKGLLTREEADRNLAEMSVVLEDEHLTFAEMLIADGLPTKRDLK
jgi:hypothetical protein